MTRGLDSVMNDVAEKAKLRPWSGPGDPDSVKPREERERLAEEAKQKYMRCMADLRADVGLPAEAETGLVRGRLHELGCYDGVNRYDTRRKLGDAVDRAALDWLKATRELWGVPDEPTHREHEADVEAQRCFCSDILVGPGSADGFPHPRPIGDDLDSRLIIAWNPDDGAEMTCKLCGQTKAFGRQLHLYYDEEPRQPVCAECADLDAPDLGVAKPGPAAKTPAARLLRMLRIAGKLSACHGTRPGLPF